MGQKIKKIIILSVITLISVVFLRCQKDDDLSNQLQDKIQTVTIDEAKDFLKHFTNKPSGKSANNDLENFEFDQITQEKINGSNELLTVIPLATNNNLQHDRVLLVKTDGEIKSVVFSMLRDENSNSGLFSGKLFIYSLEGDFIDGYKAKDGVIKIQYVKLNSKLSLSSKTINGGELSEVIIPSKPKLVNAFDWDMIWGSGGSSMGYSPSGGASGMSWDAASGGSNGGSTSNPTDVIMPPPPPKVPISDIKKFLSCLNTAASANLTVYAEKSKLSNLNVRHAFISISQGNNVMVYGFYPENGYDKSFSGQGIMGNNGGMLMMYQEI